MEHHEPHKNGNKISDVILGGQDGLVSILGLLLGLVAATSNKEVVIAGGLATIFAETLSMAAVAYTSKMANREHYVAEKAKEAQEIIDFPEQERQEIVDIYSSKGFNGKLLGEIVDHITSDKKLWVDTMMREELNLLPVHKKDVYIYSFVVGVSTLSGALLPLVPFFFLSVHASLICSLIITVIALGAVGAYKAIINTGSILKSTLQMIIIGMGAAIAGYLIGLLFKS